MGWFSKWIKTYNDGILYQNIVEQDPTYEDLLTSYEDLLELHDIVEQENKDLLAQLNPMPETKPDWLMSVALYQPKRRFVSKNFDEYVIFEKPQDVFDESVYLYRLMRRMAFLDSKTMANAKALYKWLVKRIDYENDRIDNWRPVTETLLAGKGDCDDSAMVLTSAFGMAGWPSNEVFLSVGWYIQDNGTRFYHAWCNVKIDGKWYIAEGTDQYDKLKLWSSNKHKYELDELWNWKWDGILKSRNKFFLDE